MSAVLLVEDNVNLSSVIVRKLSPQGFQITAVYDGASALKALEHNTFDAIILDWMLPDIDGLEIMRSMQAMGVFTPVLMLTARSDEIDRIVGLEVGADDYLTKPFSMRELVACLHALLRRVEKAQKQSLGFTGSEEVILFGKLKINLAQHRVTASGQEFDLSPLEFDLLALLAGNPGRVFNRRYLMTTVWNQDYIPGDRSVDNTVLRLRKKLSPYGDCIEAVWGVGYRMVGE